MNISISGYLKCSCSQCDALYTVESKNITFVEDESPESEDDEYIRYLSHIEIPCETCANRLRITVEVWENPTAVANYSYYSVLGAKDIACEFSIEHYFDEEAVGDGDGSDDWRVEKETIGGHEAGDEDDEGDEDLDEEIEFNESLMSNEDVYEDRYDEDPDA